MRNRAYRRHERAKALARAKNRAYRQFYDIRNDPEGFEFWARLSAITPHPCSRHCCGNPRRWCDGDEKLTMAERRQRDRDLTE